MRPERKQTRVVDDDEEDEDATEAEGGSSTDVLDTAWFVPASHIGDYKNSEKVYDINGAGHRKLRKYARGTFIYRLGGRDRTDKVTRKLYPAEFERLKQWRKEFIKSLERHEIARLQQLSALVDDLWQQHTVILARDRDATEDPLPVWPAEDTHALGSMRSAKDAISKRGLFNDDGELATPFRRLKLVMDYWCALWFWPIRGSGQLPSRKQWWMEIGAILEGNVVDLTPHSQFDLGLALEPQPDRPGRASAKTKVASAS